MQPTTWNFEIFGIHASGIQGEAQTLQSGPSIKYKLNVDRKYLDLSKIIFTHQPILHDLLTCVIIIFGLGQNFDPRNCNKKIYPCIRKRYILTGKLPEPHAEGFRLFPVFSIREISW